MKILIIIIISFFLSLTLRGQSGIKPVLDEIQENNTALSALRQQMGADSILNRTGLYLANPELEVGWFSGSPGDMGDKTTLSLVQSFHFPTAYIHKSRIAGARDAQLGWEYERQSRDIHLEAHLLCLQVVYLNALWREYEQRLEHAGRIAHAYASMLEAGETNILEHNKARLNLLNLQKEAEKIQIQRQSLLQQLEGMNGGKPIILEDDSFDEIMVPADFEQWFLQARQQNPSLQWLLKEAEISQRQVKLQRAMSLPSFSVGYASEELPHERFRGVVVGMSIPLWENKNTVRHAQARSVALESITEDRLLQFYNTLKQHHATALSLQSTVAEYKSLLQSVDSSALIERAWDEGEINLTQFILELSYYYQSADNILEMEWELQQAMAMLNQFLD